MILPIYTYGNPVLREISKDITPKYPNLNELIENMFETLHAADGVGLAAPQIGLSIRLFIIDATVMSKDYPELKDFKKAFINPRIVSQEGEEWYYNEGCLSVPDIREDILRKSIVKLQYDDEQFHSHTEVYDGIKARIILHEYEHLDGILFIDHLSTLRKTMLKSKLNHIVKGEIKPKYKVVFAKSHSL